MENGENINLKKATISDIPTLIEIERSVAGTNIYSPMLQADEWEEELQRGDVYLIVHDGATVGNISYREKDKNHVYISGLAIDPHFQGRGIAREAMIRILEKLKDISRVDMVTHPDNVRALKLYQSLGFIIESRKENFYGDGEPRLVLVLKNN
ncbi:MAG: GNAT family N-acetyltransferase [Parcubacteria group bacterium]|nr:GNAT family N-acetyltransferase [Parcubacteria group bacterium]MCR4342370.1 GNAT family N-acetyltransferase [Patescibacteria group bacterium]